MWKVENAWISNKEKHYNLVSLTNFFQMLYRRLYCMWIETPIETNDKIKTKNYSFWLVSDIDVEKSFFLWRVKFPYQQFLTLHSFMKIFRSSRLQTLIKTGAVKNFAIFWIKKGLQQRCFTVNIAKFLRTAFLQNFSGGCFCIIKVIKQ